MQKLIYRSFNFSVEERKKHKKPTNFFSISLLVCNLLVVATLIMLVLGSSLHRHLEVPALDRIRALSYPLGTLGVFVLYTARKQLGHLYSDCNNAYLPAKLRTNGLYAYIRHPIYTGNLLLSISVTLVSPSFLTIALSVILFTSYALVIPREEKSLRDEFQTYALYQEKTGKIFPKVEISRYSPENHAVTREHEESYSEGSVTVPDDQQAA